MSDEVRSILLGTAGLSIAGVAALFLTLSRGDIAADRPQLRATIRLAIVAVLLQSVHFAEEYITSFYQRFPELLGLTPWSLRFFVAFNLFWIAIWGLSIWGLAVRRRIALFPLWFLAIGCVANGVVHPLFAIRTAGYFPGLLTAPLIGVVGILFLRQLLLMTGESDSSLEPT